MGVATSFHAVGMGIGLPDYGAATIELMPDGTFKIGVGCEDIGGGNSTVYAQVAAELLNCDIEKITVIQGDTAKTLDSGTVTASRSTYTGGKAIAAAVPHMFRLLTEAASALHKAEPENILIGENEYYAITENGEQASTYEELYAYLQENRLSTKVEGHFMLPKEKEELPGSGGAPHHLYGYLTHLALVEVDTLTGETEVLRVVSIPDAGKVLNPQGLEGQAEGGAVMGIGYTLYEDVLMEGGYHQTANFTNYIIPTIRETPVIETFPVESTEETGPFGAKGIGEVVMIPIIAAIMNAIYDAAGVRIMHLPATPERIYQALKSRDVRQ
ncbi:molybdopterin-dependent oxidoreductase [Fictibacillus enclensis]|nr:molybdopterin cofactor-binding domain-containing protein [Fictibacillus enclensis]MDM5198416.1 molybdopterin-dependent oxidoreductase [Fictibacillus enclensis]